LLGELTLGKTLTRLDLAAENASLDGVHDELGTKRSVEWNERFRLLHNVWYTILPMANFWQMEG
jgi:hypothetical protein